MGRCTAWALPVTGTGWELKVVRRPVPRVLGTESEGSPLSRLHSACRVLSGEYDPM